VINTAMGWRAHTGWALAVVVRGTASAPDVLARQRVELLEGTDLPGHAYHAAQQEGLAGRKAAVLVERVERAASNAAATVMRSLAHDHDVDAVAVIGKPRRLPGDIGQILTSHALLHAAEGALFEHALIAAAEEIGMPAQLVDPAAVVVSEQLDGLRATVGAPWQKDHKLAAAAAFAALTAR
jgi:hypothetical protein